MIPSFPSAEWNATLNVLSFVLLSTGYWAVRRRRIGQHKFFMLLACLSSCLFLISYLYYHRLHGSTPYTGEGWIRFLYFAILISHTILAVAIVPLAATLLYRAFTGQFVKHAALARVTLPIWLYVSLTGVAVYWMLYRL